MHTSGQLFQNGPLYIVEQEEGESHFQYFGERDNKIYVHNILLFTILLFTILPFTSISACQTGVSSCMSIAKFCFYVTASHYQKSLNCPLKTPDLRMAT